jgi:hypothetical protein
MAMCFHTLNKHRFSYGGQEGPKCVDLKTKAPTLSDQRFMSSINSKS